MIKGRIILKVKTPLGITIRTTEEYWTLIVESKHPIIKRYEKEVKETLREPDEIRKSRKDPKVQLYYRRYKNLENRYVCVLIKQLNGEGFIVTAYLADKIKRGNVIWQRNQKKS
ncbi:MAG: hypothetical protein V3T58_03700 [Candidatus Hydrothermarchaeales archaeon]